MKENVDWERIEATFYCLTGLLKCGKALIEYANSEDDLGNYLFMLDDGIEKIDFLHSEAFRMYKNTNAPSAATPEA